MKNNRRNNKMNMSITEQLEAVKEYCCFELCKYHEAYELGSLTYPDRVTTAKNYLEENYCEKCKIQKEI